MPLLLSGFLLPPLRSGGGERHPRYGVVVRITGEKTCLAEQWVPPRCFGNAASSVV